MLPVSCQQLSWKDRWLVPHCYRSSLNKVTRRALAPSAPLGAPKHRRSIAHPRRGHARASVPAALPDISKALQPLRTVSAACGRNRGRP